MNNNPRKVWVSCPDCCGERGELDALCAMCGNLGGFDAMLIPLSTGPVVVETSAWEAFVIKSWLPGCIHTDKESLLNQFEENSDAFWQMHEKRAAMNLASLFPDGVLVAKAAGEIVLSTELSGVSYMMREDPLCELYTGSKGLDVVNIHSGDHVALLRKEQLHD